MLLTLPAWTSRSVSWLAAQAPLPAPASALDRASHLFFSGRYEESAALAVTLRDDPATALAAYELRTSALHFQIKRLLGNQKDRKAALAACQACPDLLRALNDDIAAGRTLAKARLKTNEHDDEARFLLGKIDLTHVWLNLETLGRRTGWGEYWEARRGLDAVLDRHPTHIRARVARAWIDYIVDTRVPWAVRWMLGGGNRKKALRVVAEASEPNEHVYAVAEARFAHVEMLTREGREAEALTIARTLYTSFPENADLERLVNASQ